MKKKVLFIIWSFSYGGGAEKILSNIVNNLDPNKYEIDVLEYLHSNKMESVNSNVNILRPILDDTKEGVLSRIYLKLIDKIFIKICPGLIRKIHLNKKYDVEISFNYLIPTFLLNYTNTKTISWIHGSIYDLNENKYLRNMQRYFFKKVDQIVAISNVTEKSIFDIYPEFKNKTKKIYNGYDFGKMKSDTVIDDFDLLYCNRFDFNKDPLRFIKIVKSLHDTNIPVKAKMLGTGDLFEKSNELIKKYGLENSIEVLGFKKNPYSYFEHCKVFCLTSHAEGFPTTLVESMCFGKPFVSSNVAGADELSKNGICGYVANNDEEYLHFIKMLLTDPDLYIKMSYNCKINVNKYSLSNQINNIELCIDE